MHHPLATRHAARSPERAGAEAALRAALLDSRQRWRGFAALGSDWAFETDAAGRFTFVWPEGALGWPEASLLGQPAAVLLAQDGFDPFAVVRPTRGRAAWVRTREGGPVLLRFSVAPLAPGPDGAGVRGVATDVTDAHHAAARDAAALRRGEMADHVLSDMREEVLVSRMTAAMLSPAAAAMGADGAALLTAPSGSLAVRHATAAPPPSVLARAADLLTATQDVSTGDGVLACPVPDRLGLPAALVFWRAGPERAWTGDDRALAASLGRVLRTVLEQEDVQHELSRQARTDALTGLLNRRAFAEELDRRLTRVQTLDGAGVLIALDLDGFKPVNDQFGHEAGDAVLVAAATLLRQTFRPADLLARMGGDEFVAWLDGADELTAAERAEELCGLLPDVAATILPETAGPVTMSVGIAAADPMSASLEDLLRRADTAMFAAKSTGGGAWHVDGAGSSAPCTGSQR